MEITLFNSYQACGPVDTLVIPVGKGDRDQGLQQVHAWSGIDADRLDSDFRAEEKEFLSVYLPTRDAVAGRVVLLGLGDRPSANGLRQALRSFLYKERARISSRLAVDLLPGWWRGKGKEGTPCSAVQSCAEGCELSNSGGARFKTGQGAAKRPQATIEELILLVPEAHQESARQSARRGALIASCQRRAIELVNAPGNDLTPQRLADHSLQSGSRHGYSVRILQKQELEEEKMGGLLAVSQGGSRPPVLIQMEYAPDPGRQPACPSVGLVGKGVTFDTGGISLKRAANLYQMKSDMAGAAAVIGAMEVVAKLSLPIPVVGVVPATENMPGGGAQKPGDILTTYSGLTVEVEDTDAEGRLILADALSFLDARFHPHVLIDLATLTGACGVALGDRAAGLFSNNDRLAKALCRAGVQVGERLWRLPLWTEYQEPLESDLADLKNYGGRPAGAITAAKFLQRFVADETAWAHLDIAATAFAETEFSDRKTATGFGVRLLVEYLRQAGESEKIESAST